MKKSIMLGVTVIGALAVVSYLRRNNDRFENDAHTARMSDEETEHAEKVCNIGDLSVQTNVSDEMVDVTYSVTQTNAARLQMDVMDRMVRMLTDASEHYVCGNVIRAGEILTNVYNLSIATANPIPFVDRSVPGFKNVKLSTRDSIICALDYVSRIYEIQAKGVTTANCRTLHLKFNPWFGTLRLQRFEVHLQR